MELLQAAARQYNPPMTPELRNELDTMEASIKQVRSQANFGPDPRVVLTNIYLIRAVDRLDRTSTILWIVNIALGVLVLVASVISIIRR
jgi:hypothetical protein